MVRFYALVILLSGILLSCGDKGNFDIGTGLVDTESSVYETQDFTVSLSTVVLDSIRTSQGSRLIVGKRTSSVYGSLEAISYFSLDLNFTLAEINKNEKGESFDSMKVVLAYSDFFIADTTKEVTIQLFRMTERLKLIENDELGNHLYNTSSFPCENTPLAEYSFFPTANRTDSLVFHVDTNFGQELIDFDKNYIDPGDNSNDVKEKYQNLVKGLVLKLKADDAFLSFNSDTSGVKFDIYTSVPGYYDQVHKYRISIASGVSSDENHFIQGFTDRSSTAFASLTSQREKLLSVNSGNRSYIQGLGGVVTRVDFPNMNNIFAYDDRVMVKAELVLYAAEENDSLPTYLTFYESNKYNTMGRPLVMSHGSQSSNLTAYKRADKNYYDKYYYASDITQYLTSSLGNYQFDLNNGLIVSIPDVDLRFSAKSIIFNGENTDKTFSPKLKLYFLKYE